MNSKQLANVLVKILGLSICAHGVVGLVSGILSSRVLSGFPLVGVKMSELATNVWIYITPTLISLAIGLYFLLSSRRIVDWLIKDQ